MQRPGVSGLGAGTQAYPGGRRNATLRDADACLDLEACSILRTGGLTPARFVFCFDLQELAGDAFRIDSGRAFAHLFELGKNRVSSDATPLIAQTTRANASNHIFLKQAGDVLDELFCL